MDNEDGLCVSGHPVVRRRYSICGKTDLYGMRNTTKLKQLLLKYDLSLSMDEEDRMKCTLVDKDTGRMMHFENSSYSQLISKSYSYFLKEIKKTSAPGSQRLPEW